MTHLRAAILCLAISVCALGQTAPGGLTREQLDRTVDETLTLIEKNFMKPMTREEIVQRALNLLLQDLDPYSRYLNPAERAEFEASTSSKFAGIGVMMRIDEEAHLPRVENLMLDSPARDAGMLRGDHLLSIDEHNLEGWSMEQLVNLLRGAPKTIVNVVVRRNGVANPIPYTITRRVIYTPSVRGVRRDAQGHSDYMLDAKQGIGYIRISRLAADTVTEVDRAVAELQKQQQLKGLILDLRDCVGGLMRAAVDTADLFVDHGKLLTIVDRQETEMFEAAPGKYTAVPMVVLINSGTASSGEILAGALKDSGRATFLGARTFGKGRIQVLFPLGDNLGALILGTGTFQRPSGKTIDRHDVPEGSTDAGIQPDEEIVVTGDELRAWQERTGALDGPMVFGAQEQPQNTNDRILDRAVAVLTPKIAPRS